ncbi:hypothetical protein ACS0TY_032432 [Phlomoides rotata]
MQRKIVINVPMHHEKAKSKAMKIAVMNAGVISVNVGENDRLEVIGEEVDSVCLANSLRKKFCFAQVVSVEEIKPPPPKPPTPPPSPKPCYIYPTRPAYYECRYYDETPPGCSII